MKRAGLWVVVMLAVLLIPAFGGRDAITRGLFFTAGSIWLLLGVAWGARGVVRYLKR